MRIAQEEIFGPVLVIQPYDDEEDAIRIANATVYGLSSHVQSADQDAARRVARRIRAGQVHINYPAWSGFAPFGGYSQSGNGREYGASRSRSTSRPRRSSDTKMSLRIVASAPPSISHLAPLT